MPLPVADSSSYDPSIALKICELVAEGNTLASICATKGMPGRQTLYKWLVKYPDFRKAYDTARVLSAQSFEEDAIQIAKNLMGVNDYDKLKIEQFKVALTQLRWSAARRDPTNFGERRPDNAGINISISTPLDLNVGGLSGDGFDNVFHVSVRVPEERSSGIIDGEFEELPNGQVLDADTESDGPSGEGELLKPRRGRPRGKGKHKSPVGIQNTLNRRRKIVTP